MLRRADFWKEESEAPLLRLNRSFLPSDEILQKIEDNAEDDFVTNFDHVRIIRLDAERTFVNIKQRTTLMHVLSFLQNEFNSYHQAMSYVAGFLLLTNSPTKVIEKMRQLHQNVLIDYWTEEPVAFATDAYVFDYLLADYYPDIHQHLSKHFILPETYTQKWFTTLCVGVLPFKALFQFFDTFVTNASSTSTNIFLFQFALSLTKHIREGLLQTKNVAVMYQYLRLDSSIPQFDAKLDELAVSIVDKAKDYDLSSYDFVKLREKAYNEKLRSRLEAAKRSHDERKVSITSSSSDHESEEEEEAQPITMKTLVNRMENLHIE
ncbi:unnamed protein product [Adineta ricciae]|uniref:Rab-GAP TBC domain-containing protein n=1 Tax=Adineta ricciae TaxID=249248 RepID=A0A815DRG9_ADIRI|nr:unnamed protein product [Adineta ricciae]